MLSERLLCLPFSPGGRGGAGAGAKAWGEYGEAAERTRHGAVKGGPEGVMGGDVAPRTAVEIVLAYPTVVLMQRMEGSSFRRA